MYIYFNSKIVGYNYKNGFFNFFNFGGITRKLVINDITYKCTSKSFKKLFIDENVLHFRIQQRTFINF